MKQQNRNSTRVESDSLISVPTRPHRRWLRATLIVLTAVVIAAGLLAGTRAFSRVIRIVFRDAPRKVVADERLDRAAFVRSMTPPDAPLFYVMGEPEYWQSRMWQRMLYPRIVFLIDAGDIGSGRINTLKERYKVRFALSAGENPLDPGFLWKRRLPDVPGTIPLWIGELK